ncbi:hypothetical protein DESAMIL20_234 [Desulfurella amilsii]|uniref:Mobile element protein n=1 Tax=Desulfurella amilsii TaxID=1562698 RepID=A0A1X4Y016_9BACT|nr:hypothetical protein DESAMIL20_234 [Desulfurella amilsii]
MIINFLTLFIKIASLINQNYNQKLSIKHSKIHLAITTAC